MYLNIWLHLIPTDLHNIPLDIFLCLLMCTKSRKSLYNETNSSCSNIETYVFEFARICKSW